MEWVVSFQSFPINQKFIDAKNYDIQIDSSLIEVVKKMVDEGYGKTFSNGIKNIKNENQEYNGENYYILTVKDTQTTYGFLFRLDKEERSKLLGIYPKKLSREDLLNIMYRILTKRTEGVGLLI